MTNNELVMNVIEFITGDMLWIAFALVVLVFYLITALLSFSFIRAFRYIGIPSLIAGIILIGIYACLNLVPVSDNVMDIIKTSASPVLDVGLVCVIMGISMIVIAKVLKMVFKKRKREYVDNIQMVDSKENEIKDDEKTIVEEVVEAIEADEETNE